MKSSGHHCEMCVLFVELTKSDLIETGLNCEMMIDTHTRTHHAFENRPTLCALMIDANQRLPIGVRRNGRHRNLNTHTHMHARAICLIFWQTFICKLVDRISWLKLKLKVKLKLISQRLQADHIIKDHDRDQSHTSWRWTRCWKIMHSCIDR